MDYKYLTDSELSSIIVQLINRVDKLRHAISSYLDNRESCVWNMDQIKNEYGQLKNKIREMSHYLYLARNREGSGLYNIFSKSIREADAEGFCSRVNANLNSEMYSSVSTAYYKLTKYKTLAEWKQLI